MRGRAGLLFLLAATAWGQASPPRTAHVFVALADNQHQGIVPVPPKLGNGDDAERNLYWGSAYGVKTFFSRSSDWMRVNCVPRPKKEVIERCIFQYRTADFYLIADAYRGSEIRQAVQDFFDAAAGDGEIIAAGSGGVKVPIRGAANVVAYVGHDGLMDFQLANFPHKKDDRRREAVILACASKNFFAEGIRASGAFPLLWTTGLMAPEAYTLKSALDGWIAGESQQQIHDRAAVAYDKYQKCGLRAAKHLFASGW